MTDASIEAPLLVDDAPDAPAAAQARPKLAYGYYVVGVLMLAYMFAFIDRMILSLVMDPVRHDLSLSETQVSLLAGFAFALFYIVLGLPFGRWADVRGRRNLIAVGIALWSLATTACGLATGFWKLFAARMAVGVGEATLAPAAYSMIPDLFPPKRLGFAMALFSSGVTIGGGLAMWAGGAIVHWATTTSPVLPILGQVAGWKIAFLAVGPPGLLVSLLVAFTVREPARRLEAAAKAEAPPVREVLAYLAEHWRTFLPVVLGFAGIVVTGYGFNVWGPAYFMRVHGMDAGQVGALFALGLGVCGTIGVLGGGLAADWLTARGHANATVKVSLVGACLQAPLFLGCYLSGSATVAMGLFVLALLVGSLYGGLQAACVQSLTPSRMRGQVGALYLMTVNMIGLGLSPTWTALMTEHVFGGPTGIGKSLAVTSGVSLTLAIVMLSLALKPARRRIEALQAG